MTATPLRERQPRHLPILRQPDLHLQPAPGHRGRLPGPLPGPSRRHATWMPPAGGPSKGELDRYGREIPDEEYQTKDFERVVALRARTEAIARHLTDFLKKTDRFAKTIVFCVDQEHAAEMREALNNLNADLRAAISRLRLPRHLRRGRHRARPSQRFQDVETRTPVILTTSQLLTTGVDAPTCQNVVLARVVNSMVSSSRSSGAAHGSATTTASYGSTSSTTPAPPRATSPTRISTASRGITRRNHHRRRRRNDCRDRRKTRIRRSRRRRDGRDRNDRSRTGRRADPPLPKPPLPPDRRPQPPRKFYVDGGQVEIVGHLVYDLDAGRQDNLQVVRYTEYTGRKLRLPVSVAGEFRTTWTSQDTAPRALRELAGARHRLRRTRRRQRPGGRRPVRLALPSGVERPAVDPARTGRTSQAEKSRLVHPARLIRPGKFSACCWTNTSSAA